MTTYRNTLQSALLILGLGALLAAPAFADSGCRHEGRQAAWQARNIEAHHQKLHEALALTSEQEGGWKKLLESEQHGPTLAIQDDWSKLKAPERAEKMLELAKARQAAMVEHVAALKTFYASLTPQQQNIFEASHQVHHAHRGGHHAPMKPAGEAAQPQR